MHRPSRWPGLALCSAFAFDPATGKLSRAFTVPDVGGVPHGTVFGRR